MSLAAIQATLILAFLLVCLIVGDVMVHQHWAASGRWDGR